MTKILIEDFLDYYLIRKEILIKSILVSDDRDFDETTDYPLSIVQNSTEKECIKVVDSVSKKYIEMKVIFDGLRSKRDKRLPGAANEKDNAHRIALLSFLSEVWDKAFPSKDNVS